MKKIKGMDKLSLNIPIKIKLLSSETFLIVDTRNYKNYISGGIDKESFIPIKNNMKKGRKELYHTCIIAIHLFYNIHDSLREINNENHIMEEIKTVKLIINFHKEKKMDSKNKNYNKQYLKK